MPVLNRHKVLGVIVLNLFLITNSFSNRLLSNSEMEALIIDIHVL